MRRLFAALTLAVLLTCLALTPRPTAHGCAAVMGRGEKVAIASESALIVYDEATKTEHFIRRANFRTDVPYFGFLVPTPNRPDLGEAPDELFDRLEDWTKPEVQTQTRVRYRSLLPQAQFDGLAVDAMPKKAAAGVHVFEQKRVGNFDATVLKANDKAALEKWLQKHGYDARPAVMQWLDAYIKDGWFLTAFQMVKPEQKQPGLDSRAVRMTFQTDRPFYPYREPTDAREGAPAHGRRFLRVFYVGSQRAEGKLDDAGQSWPGQAAWANPLEAAQVAEVEKRLGEKGKLPQGAWLTVFDDGSYPRPGTGEVFFSPAADQSTLKRPPIIRYNDVERVHPGEVAMAVVVLAVPVLGLGGILFLVWRLARRQGRA